MGMVRVDRGMLIFWLMVEAAARVRTVLLAMDAIRIMREKVF
jgi:hypothetical protein